MAIQLVSVQTMVKAGPGPYAANSQFFKVPNGIRQGDLMLMTFALAAQTTPTGIGVVDGPSIQSAIGATNALFDFAPGLTYRQNNDYSVSGSPNRYYELSVCSGLVPADCTWFPRRLAWDVTSPSNVQELLAVLRVYREVHNSGPSGNSNIRDLSSQIDRVAATDVLGPSPFSVGSLAVGDLVSHAMLTPYSGAEVAFTPNDAFGTDVWILQGAYSTLAVGDALWPYASWTSSDTSIPASTQVGTFDVAKTYTVTNIAYKSGGTPGTSCAQWNMGSIGLTKTTPG